MAAEALSLTLRLASVGFLVSGLEQLRARQMFSAGHPMSRGVVSRFHARPLTPRSDRLLPALLAAQIAAALWLVLLGPAAFVGAVACICIAVCLFAVRWRRTVAGDGAEQLGILVAIAGVVAFVPTASSPASTVAVAFIAGEVLLSYVTAGAVKLISTRWRQEPVLAEVLSTHRFGSRYIAGYLGEHMETCLRVQWLLIAFELLFPVGMLLPRPAFLVLLAIGIAFHVSCAALMGLNTFLWSFPATYPCLYYAWSRWSPAR
jgi:hypothetical protein